MPKMVNKLLPAHVKISSNNVVRKSQKRLQYFSRDLRKSRENLGSESESLAFAKMLKEIFVSTL